MVEAPAADRSEGSGSGIFLFPLSSFLSFSFSFSFFLFLLLFVPHPPWRSKPVVGPPPTTPAANQSGARRRPCKASKVTMSQDSNLSVNMHLPRNIFSRVRLVSDPPRLKRPKLSGFCPTLPKQQLSANVPWYGTIADSLGRTQLGSFIVHTHVLGNATLELASGFLKLSGGCGRASQPACFLNQLRKCASCQRYAEIKEMCLPACRILSRAACAARNKSIVTCNGESCDS